MPKLALSLMSIGLSVLCDAQSAFAIHDPPIARRAPQAGAANEVPASLSTSDWSSIRAAYEANRYAAFAHSDGYEARNPGQRWSTRFDGRGASTEPDGGGWTWGLQLERYGFAGEERDMCAPARVGAHGGRVAYDWDATLQEWWVNDTRGLEHGYTIHQRPPQREYGPLTITLAVRGDLDPRVQDDGLGVRFVNALGVDVLTYAGLVVFDADGRSLAAHFENNGDGLRLSIEEHGAHYPLTIDPTAQQAYLKPDSRSTDANDYFGFAVSVSGDTVVVGAPLEDGNATGVNGNPTNNGATDSGAAYVFVRSGTTWTQQAYLKASNTGAGDQFGIALSVSGDTIVIGAPLEDSDAGGVNGNQTNDNAPDAGAAYVFFRNGTTWSQQAYLKTAGLGEIDAYFGGAVSVSGDTVVIGQDGADEFPGDQGNAWVFVRSGTTWSQQAYLAASNGGANDHFGWSVSVSGDTAIVGAYLEDSNATGVNGNQADNSSADSGAVYVFVRSGTVWSQQAYLKASNTGAADLFGYFVSVSGDTAVVGAPGEDSIATGVNGNQSDNSAGNGGAAYVFVRSGTVWSQQAYLKASNTGAGDEFGVSVSASADTIVVGAWAEDSNATGVNGNQSDNSASNSGAAYVFVRSGTTWSQQAYLKASNTNTNDQFGFAVAASGDTVLVGAPLEDSYATGVNGQEADNSIADAGAGYVFVRSGTSWSQQAYVKSFDSVTNANDMFGCAVAMSGDTVAVGAFGESVSRGGVFVFVRSGTAWTQQAYLRASNPGQGDGFGASLSIAGDTLVVGAPFEDSNASGVNGNQFDNSAAQSGAAYVFVRSGAAWTQQAYLKASNTGPSDFFGEALSVSGDTVVVGAGGDDSNATGINGNQFDNSAVSSGAAFVFVRSGTTWTQQAYLKASNTGAMDTFGVAVSLAGDTAVIGAAGESSNATGVNGNQLDDSSVSAGAAYVFVRSGAVWSQQAYLKASNSEAGDQFGHSVSISGDTLVIGAHFESSNATGVNGNQLDNSKFEAGAAYVFVRSGTTWSQEAYLKASNTDGQDFFGWSCAVSGDTIVIGAPVEASNATGVNGNQANNAAFKAGAAYVFRRSGTTWTQHAYLKASNSEADDEYGQAVTLSGDTVVVGAWHEGSDAIGVNGSQANNNDFRAGAAYVLMLGPNASAFCFGDGTGAPCPCANSGSAGRGCASSSIAAGAVLSATGRAGASAGTDSLVLTATDIAGPGLFFQGTGQFAGGLGIPFGDGLLCAGGTILRLGVVFPTGTSASYPGGLTPNPIHVGGTTVAGDVRHYQVWYRDAAIFCSSQTYNLTQGLTLTWGP